MSELTLSEAIAHCFEVAEQNNKKAEYRPRMDYYDEIESRTDCLECAEEHRQLAEWLTELKEAKRLLKAAVEDFSNIYDHIFDCDGMCDICPLHGERDNCLVWQYADEALKLIGDEPNGI